MTLLEVERWDGAIYSGGWTPAEHVVANTNPSTGDTIGMVADATPAEIGTSVERAAAAQTSWAATTAEERSAILRRAGDLIAAHQGELAGALMNEAGSAAGKAGFEASLVAGEFYQAAATALMPYGQLLHSGKPRLSMSRRRPAGVVGVISPFNFPAILSMRSVAPALALGNAVVLKPDLRTPVSGGFFFARILEEAGLPTDLLQVIPGGAPAGEALVDHPLVRVVSFTGSTAVGRIIGERAGRNLTRAHLELGGNNALVVMADADIDAASSAGAWGSFLHQGQICMTTGRHIVHESVFDAYVEALTLKAGRLDVGAPESGAALGPLIDAKQRDRVHTLVAESITAGAELRTGGTYDDLFYAPTVLVCTDPTTPVFADEVFGPVAAVVRYSSVEDLIRIVNASPYGLSLGILTNDVMNALELSERFPAGIVHVNDQTVDDEPGAPFGGLGASGTGSRFGGHEANIEAFTETQWVTAQANIARYPW